MIERVFNICKLNSTLKRYMIVMVLNFSFLKNYLLSCFAFGHYLAATDFINIRSKRKKIKYISHAEWKVAQMTYILGIKCKKQSNSIQVNVHGNWKTFHGKAVLRFHGQKCQFCYGRYTPISSGVYLHLHSFFFGINFKN